MPADRNGGGTDPRPHFALAVTGHRDLIPTGLWMTKAIPSMVADVPGVAQVWRAIGAALARKTGVYQISIFTRWPESGVDSAARFYAEMHHLPVFPLNVARDHWRENAVLRRDLELVGRSHALLWFGGEESDGDPLCLCRMLGLPHRVVTNLE